LDDNGKIKSEYSGHPSTGWMYRSWEKSEISLDTKIESILEGDKEKTIISCVDSLINLQHQTEFSSDQVIERKFYSKGGVLSERFYDREDLDRQNILKSKIYTKDGKIIQ